MRYILSAAPRRIPVHLLRSRSCHFRCRRGRWDSNMAHSCVVRSRGRRVFHCLVGIVCDRLCGQCHWFRGRDASPRHGGRPRGCDASPRHGGRPRGCDASPRHGGRPRGCDVFVAADLVFRRLRVADVFLLLPLRATVLEPDLHLRRQIKTDMSIARRRQACLRKCYGFTLAW